MDKINVFALDVWGNEDDGYEINHQFKVGSIKVIDQYDPEGVLNELKKEFLYDDLKYELEYLGESGVMVYFNNKPVLNLVFPIY